MKKIFKVVFSLLIALQINNINAQDVESQSNIIRKNFKPGKYNITFGETGFINITEINADKSQPKDHFEVVFQLFPDDEKGKNIRYKFYAQDPLFPSHYMKTGYRRTSESFKKKHGYIVNRNYNRGGQHCVVFLNNKIYYLKNFKDKDNYYLSYVFEPDNIKKVEKKEPKTKKRKKGLGGFFKKLKKKLATNQSSSSKLSREDLIKEIQPYLNAVFAKQQKLKNTPEAKRLAKIAKAGIDAENNFANDFNNFLAINNTGKRIYVYEGKSVRATSYAAGAKIKFRCNDKLWYDFTGKRIYYPNKAILFHGYRPPKCGVGKPIYKIKR